MKSKWKFFIAVLILWLIIGLFFPKFIYKNQEIIKTLNKIPEHSLKIEKTPVLSKNIFEDSNKNSQNTKTYFITGELDNKYKASGFVKTVKTDKLFVIGQTIIIKAHFIFNQKKDIKEIVKFQNAEVVSILNDNFLTSAHKRLLSTCKTLKNKNTGALLCGIVMGDRSLFSDDFDEIMKKVSLTHITAVSGMHISILLGFIFGILGLFRIKKIIKIFISGFILLSFMSFVGFSPSVLRAGIMSGIMLLSFCFGKKRNSLNALSITIIILIIQNVYITRQIAFILSVSSTFAIMEISPIVNKFLQKHMPSFLSRIISVPLTAQLFCAPIIVLFSGRISLIGLFSNIIIVPLVPQIMIFGMLFLLVRFKFFLYLSAFLCEVVVKICSYLADTPFSSITFFDGFFGFLLLLLFLLLLSIIFKISLKNRNRFKKFSFCFLVIFLLLVLPTPIQHNINTKNILKNWEVVYCDVGQGNGSIVSLGNNKAILIDAGPLDGHIDKCLKNTGIKNIVLAVFTHLHSDHIAGLELLKNYNISQIITNDFCGANEGIFVLNDYKQKNIRLSVKKIYSGDGIKTFSFENKNFTIFPSKLDKLCNVSNSNDSDGALINNSGLTILFNSSNINYWFLGDLESEGQKSLLETIKSHKNNKKNIVLMAHHGSSRQDENFAKFLHPDLTIVSVGQKNPYGHPTKKALDLYKKAGNKIARTDICGTISIAAKNNELISSCVNN